MGYVMTEKRYKSIRANLECPNGMEYMLIKRNDGFNVCQVCSKYTAKEIVDELNSLADENEQLKSKNRGLQSELQIFKEDATHSNLQINKLADENEQLKKEKERYKRLSEIRQQQINNRILTIKEFINNCSDNKVRSVLKELFYSEVNEYDLSSENRKLSDEIDQLKQQFNYIQNSISEHIKHQKTELGQKALQEIIEDYNEWLLGHKEVKE